MWVKEWIWFTPWVTLWLGIIPHLWFFLTSSNCMLRPPLDVYDRHRDSIKAAQTLPWQTTAPECHCLSPTLKSPQVWGSKDKKKKKKSLYNRMQAREARWLEKALVFQISLYNDFSRLPYKLGAIIGLTNLGIRSKGEGQTWTGCLNKRNNGFLLSHWLKLTHTPLAESAHSFQWSSPSVSINLIWLIMKLSGAFTETWFHFFSPFLSLQCVLSFVWRGDKVKKWLSMTEK